VVHSIEGTYFVVAAQEEATSINILANSYVHVLSFPAPLWYLLRFGACSYMQQKSWFHFLLKLQQPRKYMLEYQVLIPYYDFFLGIYSSLILL
jgi:hypothetical protein